ALGLDPEVGDPRRDHLQIVRETNETAHLPPDRLDRCRNALAHVLARGVPRCELQMTRERRERIAELVIDRRDERGPVLLELLPTAKTLHCASERSADGGTESRDHEPFEEESDDVEPIRVEGDGKSGRRGEVRRDERRPNDGDERWAEPGEDRARRDRNRQKEV